jgi:hypothetical protein
MGSLFDGIDLCAFEFLDSPRRRVSEACPWTGFFYYVPREVLASVRIGFSVMRMILEIRIRIIVANGI